MHDVPTPDTNSQALQGIQSIDPLWCLGLNELGHMSKRKLEAWKSDSIAKQGFGPVIVARAKTHEETELGVFLVDAYCLGVKDSYYTRVPTRGVPELVKRIIAEGLESITPACARKLVESAIAYALGLGLAPHKDYKLAARVLGGIDPEECETTFTFGSEGKPLYIQGPNDSPAFVQHVLTHLGRRCGKDGFHYIIAAPGSPPPWAD